MEESASLVETSSPLSISPLSAVRQHSALVCLYLKRRDHECSQQPGQQHEIVHVAYIFIYIIIIYIIYTIKLILIKDFKTQMII